MASNTRSSGTAALRYAGALVALAMESGALPQVEKDVADLRLMLESSPDLRFLIRSPLVKPADMQSALSALAAQAKLSDLTRNFLLLLVRNRRLAELDAILKAVSENVGARRGELRASVETATGLSDAQKKSLEESLGKTIGRPVSVEQKVNAELIGGVVVTLGSVMIDDSVKSKLERLGRAMKHNGTQAA